LTPADPPHRRKSRYGPRNAFERATILRIQTRQRWMTDVVTSKNAQHAGMGFSRPASRPRIGLRKDRRTNLGGAVASNIIDHF